MNYNQDRLYDLLPRIYRQRDAQQGYPLKALLQVIAEQIDFIEKDIDQLYDNWFIETCQDWLVPYIGALVGYRAVFSPVESSNSGDIQNRLLNSFLIPRNDVANTIPNRRRKGSLYVLELLASDVARWPARAVEFYKNLLITQNINHLRISDTRSTVDLRDGERLNRLDGPFDQNGHTIDIHRASSRFKQGKYNIPNIGLYIWRLKAFSITHCLARHIDKNPNRYTFSILGNDTQLFVKPTPEEDITTIAGEFNLPMPINRRFLSKNLDRLYGEDKSFFIWIGKTHPEIPVSPEQIAVANLRDWENGPPENKIAVDPELGRIAYAATQGPEKDQYLWVTYHFGFPAEFGGGEYKRFLKEPSLFEIGMQDFDAPDIKNPEKLANILKTSDDPVIQLFKPQSASTELSATEIADNFKELISGNSLYTEENFSKSQLSLKPGTELLLRQNPQGNMLKQLNRQLLEQVFPNFINSGYRFYKVGYSEDYTTIGEAYKQWQKDNPLNAVIEITDNRDYVEQLDIFLREKQYLQIRSANKKRASVRILDIKTGAMDAWNINGETKSRLVLDGLLISGRGLYIEGSFAWITVRHCTLVPGWEIDSECNPDSPTEPSIYMLNSATTLEIDHSIVGSIQVQNDEVKFDPAVIKITDSVVDGTSVTEEALGAPGRNHAHVLVTMQRSTVIGTIYCHAVKLIENSILYGVICVARRQTGCIRYSYVPVHDFSRKPDHYSRTPRRYNCQPDLVLKSIGVTDVSNRSVDIEKRRVQPRFNSTRYGHRDYLQLALNNAVEILQGADDESEMGVYHNLFQPQREANLRTRLDEYTVARMDSGIFFMT